MKQDAFLDGHGIGDAHSPVTGAVSALDNLLEELGTWGKDIKEHGDMDTTDKKGDLEDQLDDLTEKLKTALETGEPMVESLGACFKCGEEIKEKSILVGDKVFCEGCFVCDSCHTSLQSRYYKIDDKTFCEKCKEKDLPRCGVCGEVLAGQYVTVGDDKIHMECFVCSGCKEPIKGKFFKDKDTGKYLCISCYQIGAEKCFKCELPILERFIIHKENKYHPECFRCAVSSCDKSLDGVGYFEEKDDIICAECYDQHFAIKCHKCGKSLHYDSNGGGGKDSASTKIITCENKKFHVNCYTCKDCDASLLDQHVFVREDHLICGSCRND